jgi:hypothetical protein
VTALLAHGADAAPTSPVTVVPAPEGLGEIFSPGIRTIDQVQEAYVEEEFLVSGKATVYNYTSDPPVRGDITPVDPNVPYTTRISIRRPVDSNDFNGTVVIEWWNSTAGFDTAPAWDLSFEYFGRKGIVYVGVTNSTTSLEFLTAGCGLFGILPPTCGTRYAALEMPENGQAFEMVSQIANLLKSSSPENPLPAGFNVERLFHVGQSQQGGSMVTYASAFHFSVNDGYFIQAAGTARPINFGPSCEDPNSPSFPDCTPRLAGAARLVDPNLPVPVYRAQTETDMERVLSGDTRQTDTDTFRYYEMAGTAHTTVHKGVEVLPAGLLSPDPLFLEETCRLPQNTTGDGPIFGSFLYNAMWENMELQVRLGTAPPQGDLIETDPNGILRDTHGNAQGGIRLPQLDFPKATYGPTNEVDPNLPLPSFLLELLDLACRLSATAIPFDQATLDTLYPDWTAYVSGFNGHIDDLVAARFLLPEDAAKLELFVEDKDQQKCIVALNKNFAKVASAQGSDICKCIKDGSMRKLTGQTIEECATADNKGKVGKAKGKTSAAAAKCSVAPDFGTTDPNTVNAAAMTKELDLVHALFGSDLDAVIVDQKDPGDPNPGASKTAAKCQIGVAKAAKKCQDTKLKVFNKCKKDGLKEASIHSAETLAECMGQDPDGKIQKACVTKLGGEIDKRCTGLDYATLFAGDCSEAATLADFKSCVEARVECHMCLGLNAADGLQRDCDPFDDGLFNASCP